MNQQNPQKSILVKKTKIFIHIMCDVPHYLSSISCSELPDMHDCQPWNQLPQPVPIQGAVTEHFPVGHSPCVSRLDRRP